ncbi:unnamed protein product, partial [Mesorhabditis belari]|uniref:Exonuclease domain-containing protein n=1 Tax=Mesorhabditis belari TaxID=2138241 RepID=A0AAF3ELY4_9BILA
MSSSKDRRLQNRQRKQVAELFLLQGKEQIEEAIDVGVDEKALRMKLKDARMEKLPDAQICLTLGKLGGTYISHEEIGDLVQFTVIGPAVKRPRWCYFRPKPRIVTQTILIRVESTLDYVGASYPYLDSFFDKQHILTHNEVFNREDFWNRLLNVPVSLQEQIREKLLQFRSADPEIGSVSLKSELLLSSVELVDYDYPLPSQEIIATKEKYAPITASSPLFSVDCEMCITTSGGHELTRVSLVQEDGAVVFDTLVKPPREITDYLTKFSGITEEMMKDVTVTLQDVQNAIRAVLPSDAILIGHSLEFDLKALSMSHPYIFDIGRRFNVSGSLKARTSLKNLVDLFLEENIQDGKGHCSVEDSWAALRLAKLKIEKGLVFGSSVYGWNYDEYIRELRKKQNESKQKEDDAQVLSSSPPQGPSFPKKIKLEQMTTHCVCGARVGLDCILEGCQCQICPPAKCILCLAKNPVPDSLEANFDWSKAVRVDKAATFRPLPYYLGNSKAKNKVMWGARTLEKSEVPESKYIVQRKPSDFKDQQDYIEEVCMDMLDFGLCLVDLKYEDDVSPEDGVEKEEGELPQNSIISQSIDQQIEQLIRAAAKHSLIIVVMSCPEKTICYLRVKT